MRIKHNYISPQSKPPPTGFDRGPLSSYSPTSHKAAPQTTRPIFCYLEKGLMMMLCQCSIRLHLRLHFEVAHHNHVTVTVHAVEIQYTVSFQSLQTRKIWENETYFHYLSERLQLLHSCGHPCLQLVGKSLLKLMVIELRLDKIFTHMQKLFKF